MDEEAKNDREQHSPDEASMLPSSPAVGNASAVSTPQKERHSLTLDQRRALRRWANAQLSRPSHKQCIEWFQRQYHQTISQSTVSHSLSPKYARLDGEPQLSGSRLRFGNWPEVEKLVLLWYQQMVHSGRHPTNDELGEKAKSIFSQLPRHRGEEPPEFSPGWIHRFKKRYGLLIRRQRRQSGSGGAAVGGAGIVPSGDPAGDVTYLVDTVPRLMSITPDTNPVAIRETLFRTLGFEPTISVCTRVRDEIIRYAEQSGVAPPVGTLGSAGAMPDPQTTAAAAVVAAAAAAAAAAGATAGTGDEAASQQQAQGPNGNGAGLGTSGSIYHPHPDDDPDAVVQNALQQLQQEADAAEAEAAAAAAAAAGAGGANPGTALHPDLSISTSSGSASAATRPVRCPFCLNQRMLRTIREAVDHMSTHVVV